MRKTFKITLAIIIIINLFTSIVLADEYNKSFYQTEIGNIEEDTNKDINDSEVVNSNNNENDSKINANENLEKTDIQFQTYVKGYGWMQVSNSSEISGTVGEGKQLEGLKIELKNQKYSGGIQYKSHVQDIGWQDFVSNGQLSGLEGKGKRLEAVEINLTGEMAKNYDVYYRVHVQDYGWLGWAKNGESAGTQGFGKRLEAIEVKLVEKGQVPPNSNIDSFIKAKENPNILYKTHVENYGWMNWVKNGELSGTVGEGKRLESIEIKLDSKDYLGDIQYRSHVQDIGWQDFVSNGQLSGTEGKAKRLEAIEIKLTDELENNFDVYYRVHVQDFGWLDWAKNGQSAGTEGYSKRLESIEIRLVKKGESAPGSTYCSFIKKDRVPNVLYKSYVENQGWQDYVQNGQLSGTEGKALKIEELQINLEDINIRGNISYRSHVQDFGWQNWTENGSIIGKRGKRLEAIEIKLNGLLSDIFDVYYRVHIQDYGWLGWAKNGQSSGSEGLSKRIEAIEVVVVHKGSSAPGSTDRPFVNNRKKVVVDPGHNYGGDEGAVGYINGVAYYERDLNMKVSLYLKEYLESYGYEVVLTRQPADRDQIDWRSSLAKRVKIANSEKADVFISVHHNSFENDSAYGTEVYYYNDKNNIAKRDKSRTLATDTVNNICRNIGFNNRGAKTAGFTVIEGTNMPGILVEGGFMSNTNELKSLVNDSIQRKIAKGIADAVKASF